MHFHLKWGYMGEIKEYKVDIIKRTLDMLKKNFEFLKERDSEVTFLMNCLLGLIVAITENEKQTNELLKGKIDDNFISMIPKKVGFIEFPACEKDLTVLTNDDYFVEIRHWEQLKNKQKMWFLKKLRNSIAHQNIEGINENNRWIQVRFWNMIHSKKDFEIIFTIEEMKTFAIELAERYVSSV